MYYTYFLSALGALALLGYAISHFFQIANPRIFNLQKTGASFSKESTWLKAFGALFTVFYLAANLIFWALFGVEQTLNFLFFLINLFKKLVLWVWHTILEPTVAFIVKLIWHYPIGFIWKNTALSFSQIRGSFQLDQHKKGAFALIRLLVLLAFVYIINSLIDQSWFDFISMIVVLAALMYTLISLGLVYANQENIENIRALLGRKFAFMLLLMASLAGIAMILMLNNDKMSVSEIGFPLSEILLPIALVLVLMIVLTVPFGIAYYLQNGETDWNSFISALVIRIPKLIYALPFLALGSAIVSIIPAGIYLGLNQGISSITGQGIEGHHARIMAFANIDNQYGEISDQIAIKEKNILALDSLNEADSLAAMAFVAERQSDIEAMNAVIKTLMKKQIFHLKEDFYETEVQTFSFPPILNCEKYTWEIKDGDDKVIASKALNAENGHSSVLSHRWSKSGKYSISVIPENSCEKGEQYVASALVLEVPKRSSASSISGPRSLCAYDEATFSANANYSQYEWIMPEGVSIIEGSGTSKIKVKWGGNSGTVSLRGNNKDEASSKYTSIEVEVIPGLDKSKSGNYSYPTDVPDFEIPSHDFTIYDVAQANDSIEILNNRIERALAERASNAAAWRLEKQGLFQEIEAYNSAQNGLIIQWFATLFGMLGFILLSILLLPAIAYFFKFNQSLYAYHQDGTHYITSQWQSLRDKDPRQPLFGWFLAIILLLLFMSFSGGISFSALENPFELETSSNAETAEAETPAEGLWVEETEKTFQIQLFAGSKEKSAKLVNKLARQGLQCNAFEKENGDYRVVLAEVFSNKDMACMELYLFKESHPAYSEAFLIVGENGVFEAFDSNDCN